MEFKLIHMVILSFKFMAIIENLALFDLRIIKMNRTMVISKWVFNTCNSKTKWGDLILPNIIFSIHGVLPSISSDEVIIPSNGQIWIKKPSQMQLHISFDTWKFLPCVNYFSKTFVHSIIICWVPIRHCVTVRVQKQIFFALRVQKQIKRKREVIGPLLIIWVAKNWEKD